MRPLAEMRAADLRGLLFDLDDTLTTHGKLTARAYAALESLHAAGKLVVPITGRPAGWCDHIARMWPVDAVVGENGAFYFWYDDSAGKLRKHYLDRDAVRIRKRAALDALAKRILAAVPGSALASDQAYRETDLAIDYCEDVPALPLQEAERIAGIMRDQGLCARISSIHVNGWFGDYDKLSTTRRLLAERWGVELPRDSAQFVFAGDSPNDAPMFAFFEHSVGVANVARFAGRLAAEPRYVTRGAGGAGFAELVSHLLNPLPDFPLPRDRN
ncbi:MAG: HAD-IIB family hydrolase [Betaproteobacteria bacterium]|nr:HAD-IIB family hydrolase [Betaproteobacteria bacterium]